MSRSRRTGDHSEARPAPARRGRRRAWDETAPPRLARKRKAARRRLNFEPVRKRPAGTGDPHPTDSEPAFEREAFAPTKLEWPARLVELLGRRPDGEVAARAGVNVGTVSAERARRGIPPSAPRRPDIEWTDAMIALLGEASDLDVAAELELPVCSVIYKRHALGIPSFAPPARPQGSPFWTPHRVALLGKRPDYQLAGRWGISPTAVGHRRRMLGIPPHRPRPKVEWTERMRAWLGREPDHAVAKRLGIGFKAVRAERERLGIPSALPSRRKVVRSPVLKSILSRPTRELAARSGLTVGTIHRLRAELAVPPPPRPTVWTRENLAKLGRVPDQDLADELGLKVNTVRKKRCERGIRRRHLRARTAREDGYVRSLPPAEAAARTGRTY